MGWVWELQLGGTGEEVNAAEVLMDFRHPH